MKISQIREHTDEELKQLHEDTRRDLFDVKVKKNVGEKSARPLRARFLRRDIARIKTVLKERENGK